jgi:hypothetical protein
LLQNGRILDQFRRLNRHAGGSSEGFAMHRGLMVWCVGLALAATPISFNMASDGIAALAAKGGNGGGNGGSGGAGGGGNGSGGGGGAAARGDAGNSGRDSAPGQNKQDGSNATGKGQAASATAKDASAYGKLNGFMHASPTALANASTTSPLGTIARIYAGVLGSYLAVDQAKATEEQIDAANEKLESAAMVLAGIANKPLNDEVVAAVNSRLGDLASQNKLPGSDSTTNAALSSLSSEDPAQQSRNATLAATIAQMARNTVSPE